MKLRSGVDVVVCTPGRAIDLTQRGHLKYDNLRVVTLDEADEMLNQGFLEQIYDIYRHLPHDIQVVLLSATLPQEILELTKKFMTEYGLVKNANGIN